MAGGDNVAAKTEKISAGKPHTRYKLADGTLVPGVTTVLSVLNKPGLVRWANQLGLQGIDTTTYVDGLARIGTLAHGLIEEDLGGPAVDRSLWSPEEMDRAENSLLKWYEWRKSHQIHPELIEHPMVSEEHRYGGTVDCYGLLDGVPTILDIKTAKQVYDEHLVQVAAYAQLVRETGRPVDAVRVLQVGRTEDEGFTERVIPAPRLEPFWRLFEHALAIYYLQQQIKREAV
jgi:hypothetical protein